MKYLRLKRFKEKNISMANGCTELNGKILMQSIIPWLLFMTPNYVAITITKFHTI
jgi:hypothetical protein